MENKTGKAGLLRRFMPYYKPYIPTLVLDLCCAILTTVCDIVLPMIVRTITNAATEDVASLSVHMILEIAGIYLLLRVIDTAANYFMTNIGHMMGAHLEADMRKVFFCQLHVVIFSFYSSYTGG